ncbi:MAG: TrkA C-terminal domain-containing protein [Bacteroidetes bacterium]|nr:TrkA C-terminal domain-containing protein [Bacteroidota bacterium]
MLPVISVITIILFSILITKIATVALVNTGLSSEIARFQARSAFSGVGFTTHEAEMITSHPIRRKIVMILMLLGNAGIVTVMASILLTFIHKDTAGLAWYYNLAALAGGVGLIMFLSANKRIDNWLFTKITLTLKKTTNWHLRDHISLVKLHDDFHLTELQVKKGDWTVGKTLNDPEITKLNIRILGIVKKKNDFLPFPDVNTLIEEGDNLTVFGKESDIKILDHPVKD